MATASLADYRTPRPWLLLAAFLVVVIGIGGLIGTQNIPGQWYQSLAKPPFNPPNWIFGPVWFILYVMIAVIAALWVTIIAFILVTRNQDRIAAWLFVPYLVWVSFASLLNLSIGILN